MMRSRSLVGGKSKKTLRGPGLALAIALCVLVSAAAAYAAPGDLDPNFAKGGQLTLNYGTGTGPDGSGPSDDYAFAVALQRNGKAVVAGYSNVGSRASNFALTRFRRDGSIDRHFGANGLVTTDFGGPTVRDEAYDVAVAPDGKIVAVGRSYPINGPGSLVVARYNRDGSLDRTFDGDGKAITRVDSANAAYSVLIQPDGKIVAAGEADPPEPGVDFAVARFMPNGSLDSSFGGDGVATTNFSGIDVINSIALDGSGRIVAVGDAGPPEPDSDQVALARYNPNGSLDQTFGGDGRISPYLGDSFPQPGMYTAHGVTVQPDGKVVVAGRTLGRVGPSARAVFRLLPNGSLDPSFDGDGYSVDTSVAQAAAVLLDRAGNIITVGGGDAVNGYATVVSRQRPDGSFDPRFGNGGKAQVPIFSGRGFPSDFALQRGKLTITGAVDAGGLTRDIALARLRASNTRR
jgi:uncharacterized delta-60 repeat protein